MFALSPWDTLSLLVCRVFLGSVFSGQLMTLFYSMGWTTSLWGRQAMGTTLLEIQPCRTQT